MGIDVTTSCVLGWEISYDDLVSFVKSQGGRSCDINEEDLCSCGEDCWFRDGVENPFQHGFSIEYSTPGVGDLPMGNWDFYLSIIQSEYGISLEQVQTDISPEVVEKGYELFLKIDGHHEKTTKEKTTKKTKFYKEEEENCEKPRFYGVVRIS